MGLFHRVQPLQQPQASSSESETNPNEKPGAKKHPSPENPSSRHVLPTYEHNGRLVTKGINPEGESGRSGFHPFHFLRILIRSATKVNCSLNLLWPFVPAAIALYWARPDQTRWIFILSYIGIVPPASLLGFAGQLFAKKLPRVGGIMLETILGGVVEIVLFVILIAKHQGTEEGQLNFIPVIQAAILGSILANLLLCLGACFLVGGLKYKEQHFHGVVSEVGSGILLVAGFGLLIPSAFFSALSGSTTETGYTDLDLRADTLRISRATSILLMISFLLYLSYSTLSHNSIFDEVLAADEERDRDRHQDMAKPKFTLFEAILAIVFSLGCISLLAYILVREIEPMVLDYHVPENFLGLILVPLVEKFAEHLTAVDEAYDDQINFALFHCLAPSVQTALFNAPLVVIIGWGLNKKMDLNFEIFMVVLLVLAILVVGNFLRDGSSNYLEGALLMIVYLIVAISAYYYPDTKETTTNGSSGAEGASSGGEHTAAAIALAKRMIEAGLFPAAPGA